MVNHITPDELNKFNMLLFLQRRAGIETSFEDMFAGWRALSEPAKANVIEAYRAIVSQSARSVLKGIPDVSR
jgi:hypothetical protein